MTIPEVYEKYKHMNCIISDQNWQADFKLLILRELWQAIKEHSEGEKNETI